MTLSIRSCHRRIDSQIETFILYSLIFKNHRIILGILSFWIVRGGKQERSLPQTRNEMYCLMSLSLKLKKQCIYLDIYDTTYIFILKIYNIYTTYLHIQCRIYRYIFIDISYYDTFSIQLVMYFHTQVSYIFVKVKIFM